MVTSSRIDPLKPNAIATLDKPWEGISGPLQVMYVDRVVTAVWVVEGESYANVPTLYLKEQPFMQAVYYRRHGWLKKLRAYWFWFTRSTLLVELR